MPGESTKPLPRRKTTTVQTIDASSGSTDNSTSTSTSNQGSDNSNGSNSSSSKEEQEEEQEKEQETEQEPSQGSASDNRIYLSGQTKAVHSNLCTLSLLTFR